MRELREIVEGWEALRRQSHQTLLATVVATRGSTYRRPGARLLLSAERWVAGGVSVAVDAVAAATGVGAPVVIGKALGRGRHR